VVIPAAEVLLGLVVLFVALLPLGAVALRLSERYLGRALPLSVTERLVVSFYIIGGLLFIVASIPIPWYGLPAVLGLILAGGVAYGILAVRERGLGLRSVAQFVLTPVGISLLLGTLALLLIELSGTWNIPLSNPYDGSMNSIWVNLIVTNHTLPFTLAPYADWGVTYPLSTAVWMTLPALLLGWPIVRIPLLLPALFLSLTIPAAYSWGSRLASVGSREARLLGPLFAAFFGLVASWPRLFVGGSYDFGFALPLLLLMLGWARPFVEVAIRPWKEAVGFGLLLGILAALNAAAAQFFVLVLLGYWVVFRSPAGGPVTAWLARFVVMVGIGVGFVVRSLVAFAAWFSYPGHVLQAAGNPPYVPPPIGYELTTRLVTGELDPFVPWKAKLSPFPILALELQVLLAAGLALLVAVYLIRPTRIPRAIPLRAAGTIAVGLVVAFLFTGLLLVPLVPGSPIPSVEWASSLNEVSIILFIFFGLVALLPLASALIWLDRQRGTDGLPPTESTPAAATSKSSRNLPPRRESRSRPRWIVLVALVLVILVPLGTGAFETASSVPNYLQQKTLSTGNATAQDVSALQWAGQNLPTCSRVLVAPGSAGQFLPEFANAGLVFPMLPIPVNLSYSAIVAKLIAGTYDISTRSALVVLNITEIMGTGETFGGYPPFNLTGILGSPAPDFKVLFDEGDASILEFLPEATQLNCFG
jgi:hypothetical protein